MGAKFLLWLDQELPDDATWDDVFNALAAAMWWATFWSSLEKEPDATVEKERETKENSEDGKRDE